MRQSESTRTRKARLKARIESKKHKSDERDKQFKEAFKTLAEEQKEALREDAIALLDDFNKQLYDNSNGTSLPAKIMIEQNMKDLLLDAKEENA